MYEYVPPPNYRVCYANNLAHFLAETFTTFLDISHLSINLISLLGHFIYLFVYLFIYLFIYLSIYIFIYLIMYLFIYLFINFGRQHNYKQTGKRHKTTITALASYVSDLFLNINTYVRDITTYNTTIQRCWDNSANFSFPAKKSFPPAPFSMLCLDYHNILCTMVVVLGNQH